MEVLASATQHLLFRRAASHQLRASWKCSPRIGGDGLQDLWCSLSVRWIPYACWSLKGTTIDHLGFVPNDSEDPLKAPEWRCGMFLSELTIQSMWGNDSYLENASVFSLPGAAICKMRSIQIASHPTIETKVTNCSLNWLLKSEAKSCLSNGVVCIYGISMVYFYFWFANRFKSVTIANTYMMLYSLKYTHSYIFSPFKKLIPTILNQFTYLVFIRKFRFPHYIVNMGSCKPVNLFIGKNFQVISLYNY